MCLDSKHATCSNYNLVVLRLYYEVLETEILNRLKIFLGLVINLAISDYILKIGTPDV